ncbi:glycerol-3-phosphate dehydrogenase/oxidase [Gordonia sp. ABSL1-1]|uniref:glycerol-3-phosphate dehydrogenase/oxidase n=1 Tax=Gordonia sp. ABSL1-1 TaxID=3053923 RepID=UPI002573500E|nr:glycerol-3-phosphate dehydrogenase/oxidase [Gordonia sp. ABSL1-1]MDL9936594.1 glycerol-3-phosphate dehydrogenase/oxidase [Gordonia sp. ABSL1-1]
MAILSAQTRLDGLERLGSATEPLDVLVIGGGITGAGAALDAASRGLRVALVDRGDLASGTSRWSSKLVHGGLRYLAQGDLRIARESAVERHHLMTTIAPHLIRPLRQIVPDVGPRRPISLIRMGFRAGDVLRRTARTSPQLLAPPMQMAALEVLGHCPTVRRDGLRGGVANTDGQLVDDARLVVGVARTAAAYGATICTYTRATAVDGRGATLTDLRSGERLEVAARAVINATGVWAPQVDPNLALQPSRGTHLVFDAATFGHPTGALTVPVDGSLSRFVFALPAQLGRVYVGLTDVAENGPIVDAPQPDDTEIDFLLDAINVGLARPVTRADVLGTFAGLRPLIDVGGRPGEDGALADLSRKHQVQITDGTLISAVGGKLTTYRRLAQDAVDTAVRAAGLTAGRCVTTSIPLVGAVGAEQSDVLLAQYPSLVARFGAEAQAVLDAAEVVDPGQPLAPGIDVLRAEVEFALTHEGALDADDILDRRTRLGLVVADAERARPAVEQIVAEVARR